MSRERRTHFLINRSFQYRYLATLMLAVVLIVFSALISVYFGVWGDVLATFSDEAVQNDLLTASRLQEYEQARVASLPTEENFSTLSLFNQAERLSERQKEIFKEILDRANFGLVSKLFILFGVIALGSIFLSHRIAGPLYRFQKTLEAAAAGNLTVRSSLRKGDEAQFLSKTLNQTLEVFDEHTSKLKMILKEENNPARLQTRLKEELSRFQARADV